MVSTTKAGRAAQSQYLPDGEGGSLEPERNEPLEARLHAIRQRAGSVRVTFEIENS